MPATILERLPTWSAIEEIEEEDRTALQKFIYEYSMYIHEQDSEFRRMLADVLIEVIKDSGGSQDGMITL